jgi:hypothetical protein
MARAAALCISGILCVAVAGCKGDPVGPEPAQLCARQKEIVKNPKFDLKTCEFDKKKTRADTPKRYLCYASCLEKSTNIETLTPCMTLCREVKN